MKIRIQNNSLRIRLNEREVAELNNGHQFNSKTSFPTGELIFNLAAGSGNSAELNGSSVSIIVAQSTVEQWATTNEITIAMEFPLSNEKNLSILVEKDIKV